eukprot:TRINITY_DN18450_c0_g1_i12.p1 TRINITY_DN18450_c0_g1~~TRINITY_DN18450_c0_g1_i12.p1  ORF type:complete len:717 (+),score=153.94 TRINITY_DN18450_c0_g1_i12:175-2325(+)
MLPCPRASELLLRLKVCKECGKNATQVKFSGKQMNKGAADRRCIACAGDADRDMQVARRRQVVCAECGKNATQVTFSCEQMDKGTQDRRCIGCAAAAGGSVQDAKWRQVGVVAVEISRRLEDVRESCTPAAPATPTTRTPDSTDPEAASQRLEKRLSARLAALEEQVFKNTKHWQTFFLGCLRDRDQESMRHGGCMADAFLEEAHNYWDEKVAIWYVAGRKGRIRVDFSVQLSTKLWQNLGQQYRLLRSSGASGGKMVVELEPGKLRSVLPHVDIERLNMGLHKLREVSNCYSEFGNWSFACLPYTSPGDSSVQGVAYEVTASGIRPVASPLRASSTGALEFGFLHLHTSKEECAVERAALESGRWDCELVKSKKWGVRCQASLLEVVQTTPPIPNIVHFVLTDRDTRFFDWTCYAAVKSAWERLRPTELMVHLLDGVEPTTANEWWLAALRYVTRVLPFDRAAVPIEINGVYLRHPAMIGDFYRMQVLYDWGGIYMDTDAMSLRSFDELRWYRAVFARQGGKELRPAVGLMMFEPRSSITARLLGKMKEAYDGVWAVHSVHALDQALRESPPRGAAILGHNAGGFFASSWELGDFMELLEGEGGVDWSGAWSMHLYHSQTGKYTHDPRELCPEHGPRRAGDLCRGFARATDLKEIIRMVDAGYPIWNDKLDKQFQENLRRQAAAYKHPVSRDLSPKSAPRQDASSAPRASGASEL